MGNYAAIGWSDVGDLAAIAPNREAFKAAYARTYPDTKPMNVAVSAGVLFRFSVEMKPGNVIVYPCKADRTTNIGLVDGSYRHDASASGDCPNIRPVRWVRSLPREDSLHAEIKNHADEVFVAMRGEPATPAELDEASAAAAGKQAEESAGGSSSSG